MFFYILICQKVFRYFNKFIMHLKEQRIIEGKNKQRKDRPLYEGQNSATFYRHLLDDHLSESKIENYELIIANKQFNRSKRGFKSKSLSLRSIEKKQLDKVENPELDSSSKLKTYSKFHSSQNFPLKGVKMPEIEKNLKEQIIEKREYEKKIKDLHLQIASEKKKKARININCEKIMNTIEKLEFEIQQFDEIHQKNLIQTQKLQSECDLLDRVIWQMKQNIETTKAQKTETYQKNKQLLQKKLTTQIAFRGEKKKYGNLRNQQVMAIKTLHRNYKNQNRLKVEKAKYLATIATD